LSQAPQSVAGMTQFPYSQRQAATKGDIKGADRHVYEGDIHLIFASPFSSCSPAEAFPPGWDEAAC